MGMKLGSRRGELNSEINVTPFVDVVLVLLVIFMVTAPLLMNGVAISLPQTKKVQKLSLEKESLIVSLNKEGELFLGKKQMTQVELIGHIKKSLQEMPKQTVFIRADAMTLYDRVAKLLTFLKRNGVARVSFITKVEGE